MKKIIIRGTAVALSAVLVCSVFYFAKDNVKSAQVMASSNTQQNETTSNEDVTTFPGMENAVIIDESNKTVSVNVSEYTDDTQLADTVSKILEMDPESEDFAEQTVEVIPMDKLNVSTEDLSSEDEKMGRNSTVEDGIENTEDASALLEGITTSSNGMKTAITGNTNKGAMHTAISNFELPLISYGVDVSKWQGNINWPAVRASGVTFAMVKLAGRSTGADGSLYIDAYADKNIREAQAAGIQVGVYFFSQAVNVLEAYEEASLMVNLLKNYNITFPVAFDWETADGYRAQFAPQNQLYMNMIATTFCNTVEANGYNSMIYACSSDFNNTYYSPQLCTKYKAWLARYYNDYYYTNQIFRCERLLPAESFTYKMWQFGVTNIIAGFNGFVDMNLGFFTYVPLESQMSINVPWPSFNFSVGQYFDPMTGVTAVSHAGLDATQYVTYTITNVFGVEISAEDAFKTAGTYTVKYSLIDASGLYKQVCVPMTITV